MAEMQDYTYDEADNLSIITYPDGTTVSYEYDLNDNLIKVTDREGQVTTYEYDALNRVTAMHRPNGINTYNTYNAWDQITVLENTCDDCDRIISSCSYTYDERGYIVAEYALEYLADSSEHEWNACGHGWGCGHWHGYCDWVGCGHKDGECDRNHGNRYEGRQEYGKDNGRTEVSVSTGNKQNSTGNKKGKVAGSCGRENSRVNSEVATMCLTPGQGSGNVESKPETDGKNPCQRPDGEHRNGCCDKAPGCHGNHRFCLPTETNRTFTYDDAGKLIGSTESGKGRCTYTYTYEYDLMGNRTAVCKKDGAGRQVEKETYTYNDSNQLVKSTLQEGRHTTCTYYGYDKDGNLIYETTREGKAVESTRYTYTVENRLEAVYEQGQLLMAAAYDDDGNRVFQLNYNPEAEGHCRTDCGVLFPEDTKSHKAGYDLLYKGCYDGKRDDYELIEYINDVNREYTEVLVEQSICGRSETSYVYGVDRLSMDSFTRHTGYYLYDPRGSVTGITGECGHLYQSYQYSVTGEITFGEAKHQNEYTYNGESYNPNIESQYLRARYYCVVTANFLTEDSYLGDITEPLTLNRYNYCNSNPVNYVDPSGNNTDLIDYREVYDSLMYLLKGEEYEEQIIQNRAERKYQNYIDISVNTGMLDSMVRGDVQPIIVLDSVVASLLGRSREQTNVEYRLRHYDLYLENRVVSTLDMNSYYLGRCGGDVLSMLKGLFTGAKALECAAGKLAKMSAKFGPTFKVLTNVGIEFEIVGDGAIALAGVGELSIAGIAAASSYGQFSDLVNNASKIDVDELLGKGSSKESGTETKTLFHYTNEKGMNGIVESKKLNPSLKANNPKDARYGDGQYLSDIKPNTQTPVSLAKKFINVPNKYKYTHYVEIDVTDLDVIQGREGVFVIPNGSPLDLTDRIISTGPVGIQ